MVETIQGKSPPAMADAELQAGVPPAPLTLVGEAQAATSQSDPRTTERAAGPAKGKAKRPKRSLTERMLDAADFAGTLGAVDSYRRRVEELDVNPFFPTWLQLSEARPNAVAAIPPLRQLSALATALADKIEKALAKQAAPPSAG